MDWITAGADHALLVRAQIEAAVIIEGGAGWFEFRANTFSARQNKIDGIGCDRDCSGNALDRKAFLEGFWFPACDRRRWRRHYPGGDTDDDALLDGDLRILNCRRGCRSRGHDKTYRCKRRQDHDTLSIYNTRFPASLEPLINWRPNEAWSRE